MKKPTIHSSPEERASYESLSSLGEIKSLLADRGTSKMELVNKPNELATQFFSMLRGEQGETGPEGPQGPQGPEGKTPVPGVDYPIPRDGKDGKDGKDGIGKDGLPGENGKDGVEISAEEVIEKINTALKKIDPKQVRGLVEIMRFVEEFGSNPTGGGGGRQPLVFKDEGTRITDLITAVDFVGAGVNATMVGGGVLQISVSGGSTIYSETPTGVVNGANVTYTTANTITTVYNFNINGQFIHPAEYSTSGTTITMVTALPSELSGLPFTIVYA